MHRQEGSPTVPAYEVVLQRPPCRLDAVGDESRPFAVVDVERMRMNVGADRSDRGEIEYPVPNRLCPV